MLRIALLQLVSCGRDREANLRKGDDFCRRAAARGADVALFPEMWSIGYQAFDPATAGDREAWLSLAVSLEDSFVQHFGQLARSLRMAIGITYLERWPVAPRNTLTLFDRDGGEILTYAKVHLGPWDPPDNVCMAGATQWSTRRARLCDTPSGGPPERPHRTRGLHPARRAAPTCRPRFSRSPAAAARGSELRSRASHGVEKRVHGLPES
jgi:predicted amidohydrolase